MKHKKYDKMFAVCGCFSYMRIRRSAWIDRGLENEIDIVSVEHIALAEIPCTFVKYVQNLSSNNGRNLSVFSGNTEVSLN